MVKGLGSFGEDLVGELIETGQAAGQQLKSISPKAVAKTALEQISGQAPSSSGSGNLSPGLEDLKNKKVPPPQLQKMQQQDAQKSQQQLDNTRIELNQLKIQKTHRYQQIQEDIKQVVHEKEQKETEKQQQEMIAANEKAKKAQAEAANAAVKPPGHKSSGPGIFITAQQGSKEDKTTKIMG